MTDPRLDTARLAKIRARATRCAGLVRGGKPSDVRAMAAEDIPYLLALIDDRVRDRGSQCDGWICEAHPYQHWPHDDCGGVGMACAHAVAAPATAQEDER